MKNAEFNSFNVDAITGEEDPYFVLDKSMFPEATLDEVRIALETSDLFEVLMAYNYISVEA
jgi:hypothetical protein